MKKSHLLLAAIIVLMAVACSGKPKTSHSENVIALENEKDFDSIIKGEIPVLVDFHAEWCRPCKEQSPILAEFADEMDGKVIVLKVDVDRFPNIATQYQVSGIPTLILFKSGIQVWENIGLVQKTELLSSIKQNL